MLDRTCLLDHFAPGGDASTRVEWEANEGSFYFPFLICHLSFFIWVLVGLTFRRTHAESSAK